MTASKTFSASTPYASQSSFKHVTWSCFLLLTVSSLPTPVFSAQVINVGVGETHSIPGTYPSGDFNGGSININGTLNNNGILNNNSILNNSTFGALNNGGTITNNNVINNDGAFSGSGTIINEGTINNSNYLYTNGTLTNNNTINNNNGATLYNNNTLNNTGTINNSGTGIITNSGTGTLNIGVGGTSGTLTGNVSNSGSLVFNRSNDSSYAGVISGTGTVTKSGTGTITLSGGNTYSGITTVGAGTLLLTGSISSSLLTTVQSGATISGTGTTGDLTINSGGFVTPGDNAIGTLNISGDYIQNGTYTCDVNSGGTTDLIAVTGNATLGGTLNVVPAGTFASGQSVTYTVLTSTELNGSFASVTGTSPLFTYQASNVGNDVQLTLTKTYTISQIVTAGNLGAVASYVDAYAPSALKDQFNTLTTDQLKQALSDLSPSEETQASDFITSTGSTSMSTPFTWAGMDRMAKQSGQAMAALIHQVSSLKQSFVNLFGRKRQLHTLMQVLSQASDPKQIPVSARVNMGKTNLWVQGGLGRFSQESTTDTSNLVIQGLDGNTYDTSIGLDHAVSNTLKLGVTTGYTVSHYTMKASRAKGSVNSARFGIYVLREAPSAWINAGVYYSHHRFKSDRIMTFLPAIAHQKHDGHHVSGLTEVGKDMMLSQSLVLTPYVGLGALFLHENGYTEQGAGIQNLVVKSRNSTTLQGTTGIQLANLWAWHDETPVYSFARLGVTYRRAVGSHQKMSVSLAGQGGAFTVRTRNRNRVLANPGVGLTANLCKNISATLAYEGEIGSNQRNHQALARVNWMI